jgi:hypothetical protein
LYQTLSFVTSTRVLTRTHISISLHHPINNTIKRNKKSTKQWKLMIQQKYINKYTANWHKCVFDWSINEWVERMEKKNRSICIKSYLSFQPCVCLWIEILDGNKNLFILFFINLFSMQREKKVLSLDFGCHNKSIFISLLFSSFYD